jgi:hypothetical protein
MLDTLGLWLDLRGDAVLATNLFLGQMPDEPDLCAAIISLDKGDAAHTHDAAPAFVSYPVELVVRATDYAEGFQRAARLAGALGEMRNTTYNGRKVLGVIRTAGPRLLGRDEKDRTMLTVDFDVKADPR